MRLFWQSALFIYLTLQAQRNGARGEKENGAVGYILAVAKRNGLNLKPCGVGRGGGGFKLPLPRHAASTRGTTGRKRRRQAALCFTALAQVFLAAAPEHAETSQTLECSPDFFFFLIYCREEKKNPGRERHWTRFWAERVTGSEDALQDSALLHLRNFHPFFFFLLLNFIRLHTRAFCKLFFYFNASLFIIFPPAVFFCWTARKQPRWQDKRFNLISL